MATIHHTYIPPKACAADQSLLDHAKRSLNDCGGFDHIKNEFQPLNLKKKSKLSSTAKRKVVSPLMLISIGAAIENGIIDDKYWPSQLFHSKKSFKIFTKELKKYENILKLDEPCWQALRRLVTKKDKEAGYSTAHDIACKLESSLEKLPKQWGKKPK